MKIKLIKSLGILVIASASGVALADGTPAPLQGRPAVTVSNMNVFPNGPAVVGGSVLTRYNTFVEATVSTTGLAASGAYSWWWVVFNHPEYCIAGCGLDDLPVGATPVSNGDPRVDASLLWGGGFVAKGFSLGGPPPSRARGVAPHSPGPAAPGRLGGDRDRMSIAGVRVADSRAAAEQ